MARKKKEKEEAPKDDEKLPKDAMTDQVDQEGKEPDASPKDDNKSPDRKDPDDKKRSDRAPKSDGQAYESGDSRRKVLNVHSNGEVKTGLKAALISAFINHQEDIEVTVPISSVGETYLYNFTQVLDDFTEGRNLSVSHQSIEALAKNIMEFQNVLGLIYRVGSNESQPKTVIDSSGKTINLDEWLSTDPLKPGTWYDPRTGVEVVVTGEELERVTAPLKEAGMSNEEINTLIHLALQQLDRTIVRNSFVPTALRHSLETKMFAFEKFDDPNNFSREELRTTMWAIQGLYARSCLQLSLDVFSQELTDAISADVRLRFATNMNRFIKESTSPTMPVRFSAIMEEIAPALNQERTFEGHSACGGLVYFIDSVTSDFDLDDVPRSVWMEYVFMLIRDYTGLESRPDLWEPQKLLQHELALTPLSSSWQLGLPPEILAARPTKATPFWTETELQKGFDKMEQLFKRVYLRAFMRVVMTRQEGVLTGRLLSVLDERAITRSETWDYVVTAGIRALSVVHQAYLDTFAFFYEMAINSDILMKDDDHTFTPMLLEYFNRQIDVFKRTYTPMNEAAHLKEASTLFLGINPVPVLGEIHFAYEDDILLDYDESNLDIFSDKYRYLYAHPVLQGDRFAVPAKLDSFEQKAYQWPEYSKILKELKVKYFLTREVDLSAGGTDLIQALLRYQDVRQLYNEGLGRWFQDKCEAQVFLDPDEMARELKMPLPVAEALFRDGADAPLSYKVVFRYTGALQQYVFFNPELCPIYELGAKRDDDPRFYQRFKSLWPAVVAGTADTVTKPIYTMGNGAGVDAADD